MKRGARPSTPKRSDEQNSKNDEAGWRQLLRRTRKLIEDLGGLAAGAVALTEGVRQLVEWLF
jgi:hypothetical protein